LNADVCVGSPPGSNPGQCLTKCTSDSDCPFSLPKCQSDPYSGQLVCGPTGGLS
jgi:hypothetical protein